MRALSDPGRFSGQPSSSAASDGGGAGTNGAGKAGGQAEVQAVCQAEACRQQALRGLRADLQAIDAKHRGRMGGPIASLSGGHSGSSQASSYQAGSPVGDYGGQPASAVKPATPAIATVTAVTTIPASAGTNPASDHASAPAALIAPTPRASGTAPVPVGIDDLDARLGGGLPWGGVHELMAAEAGDRTAAAGFALALAARLAAPLETGLVTRRVGQGVSAASDNSHFLWVYPRHLAQEAGLPYGPGLMAFGHDPGRFVLVEAKTALDVLWTVEEALATTSLGAVFALVDESYGARAFTASRRFALAARASGASVFLIGVGGKKLASAAPLRWQVAPFSNPPFSVSPSVVPPSVAKPDPSEPVSDTPGSEARTGGRLPLFPLRPGWQVSLVRNRLGATGRWALQWDHAMGRFYEHGSLSQEVAMPTPSSANSPGQSFQAQSLQVQSPQANSLQRETG